MREAPLAMGEDPAGRAALAPGLVTRFVAVEDGGYDPIRRMVAAEHARFTTLR